MCISETTVTTRLLVNTIANYISLGSLEPQILEIADLEHNQQM